MRSAHELFAAEAREATMNKPVNTTLMLDDLQAFCNAGDTRMGRPWSVGNHTVASNGWLLVRVSRLPDVSENNDAPDIRTLNFDTVSGIWHSIPPEATWPKDPPCKECGGVGTILIADCKECGGDGEVAWDSGYHEYFAECRTCGGEGAIKGKGDPHECDKCDGAGKRPATICIGRVCFSAKHLRLAMRLPNCEILIDAQRPKSPAKIRFAGGDGIIMPK